MRASHGVTRRSRSCSRRRRRARARRARGVMDGRARAGPAPRARARRRAGARGGGARAGRARARPTGRRRAAGTRPAARGAAATRARRCGRGGAAAWACRGRTCAVGAALESRQGYKRASSLSLSYGLRTEGDGRCGGKLAPPRHSRSELLSLSLSVRPRVQQCSVNGPLFICNVMYTEAKLFTLYLIILTAHQSYVRLL